MLIFIQYLFYMYRHLRLLFFIVCLFQYIPKAGAQSFAWATQFLSSNSNTKLLYDMTVDNDGNIYSTGIFYGTVDFDPGPGVFNLTAAPASNADAFIVKMNAAGQLIWAKQIGNTNIEVGVSIIYDPRGFLVISGTFDGTVDFDPGPGVMNVTSAAQRDIFIARFTLDANIVWVKQIGGPGTDNSAPQMVLDRQNNIVFFGSMGSNSFDCDPGPGVNIINTNGSIDGLIFKCDADCNFLWAKQFAASGNDLFSDLKIDPENNMIVGGSFMGTGDYDPGPGVATISSVSTTDLDIFAMKLTSSGDLIWVRTCRNSSGGNDAHAWGYSIDYDVEGSVYLSGSFYATLDVDPGPGTTTVTSAGDEDAYVLKLSKTGDFIWGKRFGSTLQDRGLEIIITDDGIVQSYGSFNGTVDFDPGPGTFNMASAGQTDLFINSLSIDGNHITAKKIGGAGADDIRIAYHEPGLTLISGSYNGTSDFDPGPGVFNLTPAFYDMFIVKFYPSNLITGTTYKDNNSDGVRQPNEPTLSGVVIKATQGSLNYFARSDSMGKYRLETDAGSYTVSPGLPLYYTSILPATHSANFGSLIGQQDTANHFGLVLSSSVKDLLAAITVLGPARPGRAVYYRITVKNAGTDTASGSILFTHDGHLQYLNAVPAAASYTSPSATWNFSNLPPSMSTDITVQCLVTVNTPLGTVLKSFSTANPIPGDFDPTNNIDSVMHIVTASYDPNDKKVNPDGGISTGFVSSGNYLNYSIRFQNTGTDTAFLVIVRDTLSANVDVSSFEMISASHPYVANLKGSNTIEWRFSNILLPDSNVNEQASHGFIRYRIKPKNTLVPGNEIRNKASIYFDYNAPVATNETLNVVQVVTAVDPGPNQPDVKVFPNPAGSNLYIVLKGYFDYELYDITGKDLLTGQHNYDGKTIDISWLPKGTYLLEIKTSKGRSVKKIILQ